MNIRTNVVATIVFATYIAAPGFWATPVRQAEAQLHLVYPSFFEGFAQIGLLPVPIIPPLNSTRSPVLMFASIALRS